MMRETDDLHRMVDCIPDLQNMMKIGLDLFIIIGILILIIKLAILTIIGILILIIGLVLLTIIKILIFLVLKRRNGKQERRDPQTPSPLPSESVKSEQNHPTALIMNDDHTCIPNSQLNNPMPTTPTSMPYYSDPTAATYGTPPLTTSVSTAAMPSVSSLINSENLNMIKAPSTSIIRATQSGNGKFRYQQCWRHHCGKTGDARFSGTGLMISAEMNRKVIGVKYVSDRIIQVLLKFRASKTLRITQVYAPQSGRGEDEYDAFLEQLSSSLARPSTYDIVLGDFNASTGPRENGERFIATL
uniref:Endonuclease/exonuclease/phosphatase domain-containing protein n=1 Tax=Panagrolaimus davidi TaxID=227884 RepID=A0A914R0V6_9BILA